MPENPQELVQAFYETTRGAGMMRQMPAANLAAWLPRQKREVRVYRLGAGPGRGEVIGGVEWCTRPHPGRSKPHWCWWYSTTAEGEARDA